MLEADDPRALGPVDLDEPGNAPNVASQATRVAVRMATLTANGPKDGFFNGDGPVPW